MWRQATLQAANDPAPRVDACVTVRLDPFKLPHAFRYHTGLDGAAAEASAVLDADRVRICRTLPSGIPATFDMPFSMFEGVAVRTTVHLGSDTPLVVIELLHRDPQMSVPLAVMEDYSDVIADWKAWARVLRLPMIHVGADGAVQTLEKRLGRLAVQTMKPRRRRSVLAGRRPRFLVRRKPGVVRSITMIAHDREISGWE